MGYWIHVENLPVGGGGGGSGGPDWKGCLGCLGFLAAAFVLWICLKQSGGMVGIVRKLLAPATIILLIGSVAIIIGTIAASEFDKEVITPGVIGLVAGFLLGAITVARASSDIGTILFTGVMIGVIVAAPAMLFGLAGFDLGGVIAGIVGFGAGVFLGRWIGGNSFNIGIYFAAIAIDLYFCRGYFLE